MPYKILIIYGQGDKDLADDLAARLRQIAKDIHLVVPRRSSGERFTPAIRAAIEKAEAVMLLLTADSIERPYVSLCLGAALGQRKRVVPIIVGIDPEALPGWMHHLQPVWCAHLNAFLLDLPRRVKSGEGVGYMVMAPSVPAP
jgi:TIR domain